MKTIKDYIKGLFTKKKTNRPSAFKSENQQWDNWCGHIITNLVGAFEIYKHNHKNDDKPFDNDPDKFYNEIMKIANEKYEFWDTLCCLYQCFENGDFNRDDIGTYMPKVKFSN